MEKVTEIFLSEINIVPIQPRDGLIGFCSFVLNGQFYVGDIGLHSRPSGEIRLLYPDRVLPNGKIISSFHPITKDAGSKITREISRKYNDILTDLISRSMLRGYDNEI